MKRITRTIESTRATVVYGDIKTREWTEKTVDIIGVFESEDDLLKSVKREGNLVPMGVTESKRIIKRYAIDVETFVKYAKEISVDEEVEEDEEG